MFYIWLWIGDGHGNVDQLVFRCHKKESLKFRNKSLMEQGKEGKKESLALRFQMILLSLQVVGTLLPWAQKEKK